MLIYIFIGMIAVIFLVIYLHTNRPDILYWRFRKDSASKKREERGRFYIERFREHRQSSMSRNIVVQAIPWLAVMALVVILGNHYLYFGTVLSGSMEPLFKRGDLVLMQTFDKHPKVGDIIMFKVVGIDKPITHRIIDVDKDGDIFTKGDANTEVDTWQFRKEDIMGKAIVPGGKPIVIKGIGSVLQPESGEFTILTKKIPENFRLTVLFQQFRTLVPFIILFSTIFYFFILFEMRQDYGRRFNGKNKR
ncbi:MAG TPA: signal peptidase I [candidate division Zixibacteria bacterium]|nr:signal peptidase I [candidate division Zixibacteria bacterium]